MKFIENSSEEEILAEMMQIEKRASVKNSDKNIKNQVFNLLVEAAKDFKAAGNKTKCNQIMKIAGIKNANELEAINSINLDLPPRMPNAPLDWSEDEPDYSDPKYDIETADNLFPEAFVDYKDPKFDAEIQDLFSDEIFEDN